MLEAVGLIALGLFAAAIASSMGIGGGVVYVPTLVVLFGFEQHLAQGTSLAVVFATVIVATVAHTRRKNVEWKLSIPIGIAGVVGAVVGSRLALSLPADLLRHMFGVFLILLAGRMAWRAWKADGDDSTSEGAPAEAPSRG